MADAVDKRAELVERARQLWHDCKADADVGGDGNAIGNIVNSFLELRALEREACARVVEEKLPASEPEFYEEYIGNEDDARRDGYERGVYFERKRIVDEIRESSPDHSDIIDGLLYKRAQGDELVTAHGIYTHESKLAEVGKRLVGPWRAALSEAVIALKVFHGEPGWDIYWNNAPEMQPIRDLMEEK